MCVYDFMECTGVLKPSTVGWFVLIMYGFVILVE